MLGVGAVSVAVVIAWLIIAGTLAELTFGPTTSRRGGGGGGQGQRAAAVDELTSGIGQLGGTQMKLSTQEESDIVERMRRRRAKQQASDTGNESDAAVD
jgi:hypothetical protein